MKKGKWIVLAISICLLLCMVSVAYAEGTKKEEVAAEGNPLAGLAVKDDGTPYRFAWSTAFISNEAAATMNGVIPSWIKRAGGKITSYDAQLNVSQQIAQMETIIEQRPDAIVIFPVDGAALAPVCEKAIAAGIPVFNIDSPVKSDAITCFVTYNDWEMGKVCADWLLNKMEKDNIKKTDIWLLWGAYSMDVAHWRHDGLVDELKKYPDKVNIIEGPDCSWQAEKALNAVVSAWPAHPEWDAIYQPGGMTPGVIEGFRQIGRLYPAGHPDHVFFLTCDEDPGNCQALREGYVDVIAAHDHWCMSDVVVKAMINSVCLGKPVPELIRIPSFAITKENIDSPKWGEDVFWGEKDRSDFDSWNVLDTSEAITQPWEYTK